MASGINEYIQKGIRSAEQATAEDKANNYDAAADHYMTAAEWLMHAVKYGAMNDAMKQNIRAKVNSYLKRAEEIKNILKNRSIRKTVFEASNSSLLGLPDALTYPNNHNHVRFLVPRDTAEYRIIVAEFDRTMHGHYRRINRIERIQNERWHKQYMVHRDDFQKRLNMNTEKFLYHGCTDTAANSIIKENFDRRFAGENGTVYGHGVYFSSRASYSHSYAEPNDEGEQCMFFARVLIGHSTLGDNTMKVCPRDYHTTTDGDHIYVIYHDTQAYGQYLICYQ